MQKSKTPLYKRWVNMLARCENPKHKAYKWYGARGIKVCPRWHTFELFLQDMGQPPAGKTLDRYPDNDGDYEPGNCRWATPKEQNRNRGNNFRISLHGKSKPAAEWTEELGLPQDLLRKRILRGWKPEVATSKPSRSRSITISGRTQLFVRWCKEFGIAEWVVNRRIRDGWTVEKAITTPQIKSRNESHGDVVRKHFPDAYCRKLNDGTGFVVWPGKIQPRGFERPAIGFGRCVASAWFSAYETLLGEKEGK